MTPLRICLIGDRNDEVTAHRAIPLAIGNCAEAAGLQVESVWVPTPDCETKRFEDFDAFWCVPASPYQSMEGAMRAIRFARENQRPFLGTCGGFQHALIEYARNVMGLPEADHAETNCGSSCQVISRLSWSLVEVEGAVLLESGSRVQKIYGKPSVTERYHCNFGVNAKFDEAFAKSGLRFSARDAIGAARAFELPSHPFFIGTLFQPERSALVGKAPLLVQAFLQSTDEIRKGS